MTSRRVTKPAAHADPNREFENRSDVAWSSFFASLIVFTVIDLLNLG
jgi:hypothetical protein